MPDKELAAAAKAKGNEFFKDQNYAEAIKHFTEAIKHDDTDHVFYSNRSACFASLEKYDKAYADGKKCVELKPDWAKGYTRKGLAEFFLEKYNDAADTYKAGLKLSPDDAAMKEGLAKAMDAKYEVPGARPSGKGGGKGGGGGGGGGGGMTIDPMALQAAALKNPKIAEYMKDKALMDKLNMITQMGGQAGGGMQQQMMLQMIQQDQRLMELFMAMQGIDVSTADDLMGKGEAAEPGSKPSAPAAKQAPKKNEPPPPEDFRSPETKEADEWKGKGNEFYKAKKFTEALEMYDKAIVAQPNDITYHNNKCAVWAEMAKTDATYYDKVLATCKDLLERRYDMNSANSGGGSFEKVAKVYNRMAAVYEKQKKFDDAIEYYNKALTEDNNRQTRNALRELEKNKEKWEKDQYFDPVKAEEHNEAAKKFFGEKAWPDCKKEYDEAIKRNPKDPKYYCNRAAVLTKLMAYPDALRDLDDCLKIDDKFMKAFSRKGTCHYFMKEYHKALKAYEDGLKLDKDNKECLEGREQVLMKIQETSRSGEVDQEQIAHAMADPEIQQILNDPQIKMFLQEMKERPAEANKALNKDAKLQEAVSKLIAAGILRTG